MKDHMNGGKPMPKVNTKPTMLKNAGTPKYSSHAKLAGSAPSMKKGL